MTEVWRCINECFLEDIVFLVHACRKLAILNSPRKVCTERGDEGKALGPLNLQNAKGEAFVVVWSLERFMRNHGISTPLEIQDDREGPI